MELIFVTRLRSNLAEPPSKWLSISGRFEDGASARIVNESRLWSDECRASSGGTDCLRRLHEKTIAQTKIIW